MIFRLCLMAVCLVAFASSVPDMYGILNILYLKADPDQNKTITKAEMATIYSALDLDDDGLVSQSEFVESWSGITEQSKEMATAYFLMSDFDHSGSIDEADTDAIFTSFDLDNDGFVSDDEFVKEYSLIYRTAPFVVLFQRVLKNKNESKSIDRKQFENLFDTLPGQVDGSMTKVAIEKAWASEAFGPASDADIVVKVLDDNKDDVISKYELGSHFDELDVNLDGRFELDEIKAIVAARKDDTSVIG